MTDQDALAQLVFARATEKEARLSKRGLKLAHYTSADTAVKIIRNKDVWLRNAAKMNDYREIQHGGDGLRQALGDHGSRFSQALEPLGSGFADSIINSLNERDYFIRYHTYILSVSEHLADDRVGRLSMWRAYGGPVAGVALVFNPLFIDFDSSDLAVWTSPVVYGDSTRFSAEFGLLVDQLASEQKLLERVGAEGVHRAITSALEFAILSFKHAGFREEREWRLIHQPKNVGSQIVQPTFETVGGAPEQVYHLPLQDPVPSNTRPNYNLDSLLHRVIIGPSMYPILIAQTIEEAMRQAGVNEPDKRISFSEIPLRQQV